MARKRKQKFNELRYIITRNVITLTNIIMFVVVILLVVFGELLPGLFIGTVIVIGIALGLIQDILAWRALRRLQLVTAPVVNRLLADGSSEIAAVEDVKKGNLIILKVGDQIVCDGEIIESRGLEVNEGLITGESNSLPRAVGERVQGGSIVISGSGLMRSQTVYLESRIARMTEGIRKYSVSASPIQRSVGMLVKYSGYVLAVVLIIVVSRGLMEHQAYAFIVKQAGTLTSILVPQGLVFAVALFFAYGAAHFFRRHVLLQEVNATEKLCLIKNLCMDKTGTLTSNNLSVEELILPPTISLSEAKEYIAAYIQGADDSSEIIRTIRKYLKSGESSLKVNEARLFSSWRKFGAVRLKGKSEIIVFAGLPDTFLPYLAVSEKKWLKDLLSLHAQKGQRTLCFVRMKGDKIPENLSGTKVSVLAFFVFSNELRPGIKNIINFFQERKVRIRIISGDNPETTSAIAASVGIAGAKKIITGREMESWSEKDFISNAKLYSIFAQVAPEQKEEIVAALRKDGFTAMVGDGANDALAIKKADLGIAMFDGAPATRQLASVVLSDNSFEALPAGISLADSIIRNIEIFASMFLTQSVVGFSLFIFMSLLGQSFPLTPLNITLINYLTIAMPGTLISYWVIYPSQKTQLVNSRSFLKKILPFVISSALVQVAGIIALYFLSPDYLILAESNTLILLGFMVFGFIFFVSAPRAYCGAMTIAQRFQVLFFGIIGSFLLWLAFRIPLAVKFFDIRPLTLNNIEIIKIAAVMIFFSLVQYVLAFMFGRRQAIG